MAQTIDLSGNDLIIGDVYAGASTAGASGAAIDLNVSLGAVTITSGSGAPSATAPQGSLYLRTDGSSTSTRAYINTDGSTTWTSVTTAT